MNDALKDTSIPQAPPPPQMLLKVVNGKIKATWNFDNNDDLALSMLIQALVAVQDKKMKAKEKEKPQIVVPRIVMPRD